MILSSWVAYVTEKHLLGIFDKIASCFADGQLQLGTSALSYSKIFQISVNP